MEPGSQGLNLCYLFDENRLLKLTESRNIGPKNFFILFEDVLETYLESLSSEVEISVTLPEFYNIVEQRCKDLKFPLGQVIHAFEILDNDCSGKVAAHAIEKQLASNREASLKVLLEKIHTSFSHSVHMPGVVDIFANPQSFPIEGMIDFLFRNRCEFKALLPSTNAEFVDAFEKRITVAGDLRKELFDGAWKVGASPDNVASEENSSNVKINSCSVERSDIKGNDMSAISSIWLLKILNSLSSALMTINPSFVEEAINHTKWALNLLDFFQLNPSLSSPSASFPLSKEMITELRSFSSNLTKITGAQEVQLWFELVCGDVGKALEVILLGSIHGPSTLVEKLCLAKEQILERESTLLHNVKFESDGSTLDRTTADGRPRHMGGLHSKHLHLLTSMNDLSAIKYLKIVASKYITGRVQVFICNSDERCDLQDVVKKLSASDDCLPEDLQLIKTVPLSGTQYETKCCFDRPVFKKKIFVRFEAERGPVNDVSVSAYGVPMCQALDKLTKKMEGENERDLSTEALLFFSSVAACQSHKVSKCSTKQKGRYNFSTFSNAHINESSGALGLKLGRGSENAVAVAQLPLSKDCPYFEIEITEEYNAGTVVGLVGKRYSEDSKLPGLEPWTLGFHGSCGGIYEGCSSASEYMEVFKKKEKVKWCINFGFDKKVISLERDGKVVLKRDCSENIEFYPAIVLQKAGCVTLMNEGAWRAKEDAPKNDSLLNVESVSVDVFLKLMQKYRGDSTKLTSILHLLHSLIPFFPTSIPGTRAEELLDFLLDLIGSSVDNDVTSISWELVSEGATIFFVDGELRTNTFLKLFASPGEIYSKRKTACIFESLCNYFSRRKPQALLNLPDHINDIKRDEVLKVMKTLFHLAHSSSFRSAGNSSSGAIFSLLSSLQTLIFVWCANQACDPNNEPLVYDVLASYLKLALNSATEEILALQKLQDDSLDLALKENLVLSTSFRQLLVLIGQCSDWLSPASMNGLLGSLKVFHLPLRDLVNRFTRDNREKILSDSNYHWLHVLISDYCQLIGKLCSISIQVIQEESVAQKMVDGSDDVGLLTSDIWRLIFRAGLQSFNKQEIQRSLSGKHGAVAESEVLSFLLTLIEGEEDRALSFIKRCQELAGKMHAAGGNRVTSSIVALFSALVWHTQSIREDLERCVASDFKDDISDCIVHAYKAAETLRMPMMKKRQDMIEKKETKNEEENVVLEEEEGKMEDTDAESDRQEDESKQNEDASFNCPIVDMKSKSEFLLLFAGLQKMQDVQKKRSQAARNTNSRPQNLKQSDLLEMYPSFQLVLNFVKDPQWSQQQVENLLEARRKKADMLVHGYKHAREFLETFDFHDINSQTPRLCIPSFFGGLLEGQNLFPKHHLDFVDGCGLLMETKVRRDFYCLVKLLLSTASQLLQLGAGNLRDSAENVYSNYIAAATLHLVDINWQVDDLATLVESDVIDFLLSIISGFQPARVDDADSGEKCSLEEEMKMYSRYLEWTEVIESVGINEFKYPARKTDRKLEIERTLFAARYQLKYNLSYSCDFCQKSVKVSESESEDNYYRCVECNDFDICPKCVNNHGPHSKHRPGHKVVHFRYVCKGCQGVILTVKYSCEQCPKVQWCTGCVLSQNLNHSNHTAEHKLKKEELPSVLRRQEGISCTASYNQNHACLLLANIALTAQKCITSKTSKKGDGDYLRAAGQLYDSSVRGVIRVMMERNSIWKSVHPRADVECEREWSADDVLFGLLARLLPHREISSELSCIWIDGRITDHLISIVTEGLDEGFHERKVMALNLVGRVFESMPNFPAESLDLFVNALMELGSRCLRIGQLRYCGMAVDVLRAPLNDHWTECLVSKLCSKILDYSNEPDKLLLVFYALVLAGFPKITSFGSLLNYVDSDENHKEKVGVMLRARSKDSFEVVNAETRKREQAKSRDLTHIKEVVGSNTKFSVPLLEIIDSLLDRLEGSEDDSGMIGWFVSLLIKAQSQSGLELERSSLVQQILPKIAKRAFHGTQLSRDLMPADVEILVSKLVTLKSEEPPAKDEDSPLAGSDPLADVDDLDLKLQLEMMAEDDNILNRYICRAIYDLHKDNRDVLADVLTRVISSAALSDELKEALKEVEAKYKRKSSKGEEAALEENTESGFKLFGFNIKQEQELLKTSELVFEECDLKPAKLMSSKEGKEEDKKKQEKGKINQNEKIINACLEKAKLDEDYKKMVLKKATNTLICMNSKRLLVAALLSNRFEDLVKIDLLTDGGASNEDLWTSLATYLLAVDKDESTPLLKNIIYTSSPSTLARLANSAHNFMLEVTMRETVDLGVTPEGFVDITGASTLSIQFCEGQTSADESPSSSALSLLVSASASFTPLIHSIPISDSVNVGIQDSKFYYKVDGGTCDKKFMVLGKVKSKEFFTAGLMVFRNLVDDSALFRQVNAETLWVRLLTLFCQLNGTKRLKILSLLLKIIRMSGKRNLDFSLLSHAWNCYKRLSVGDHCTKSCLLTIDNVTKPAIYLGLTELFTNLSGVENMNFITCM